METKTIDEYYDIDQAFINKSMQLHIIANYMKEAIDRLCDVRQAYSRLHNFTNGENYNSHECIIKEMVVQRWILRFETELKK